MSDVPELTRTEINELLKRVKASPRAHHLVAIFGNAKSSEMLPDVGYEVVPVRSELELRERMPPLDEDPQIAFLVPWLGEVPIDIASRFALNGRVQRADPYVRLQALFGAKELDEGVARSPLARYLLSRPSNQEYRSPHGRLTLDQLWRAWLRAEWKVEGEELALDTLMAWASRDERGARFVEAMAAPEAEGMRNALLAYLGERLGPAAPLIWASWEKGQGRLALEWALVFEPLRGQAATDLWIKAEMKAAFQVTDERIALDAADALGRVAQPALRLFEQAAGEAATRNLLRNADAHVTVNEVRQALVDSSRLPSAWRERLNALGRALLEGSKKPSAETVAHAVRALRRLESHSFFRDQAETRTVQRADMAVRLLAWLVDRTDRRLTPGAAPHAEMPSLARWYADEGGFVDRARHAARAPSEGVLGQGITAVVDAADTARTDLDRRFARALAAWHEAGRPSSDILPIEDAVKRVAAQFLSGNESRRLLILLIDGMAWAQATEILESLGERGGGWGPLAWHRERGNRIGEGFYPPMIAGLPTVTQVSRSAFFAGKPPKPGTTLSTSDDPKRWLENSAIKPFLTHPVPNELLLRPDGHSADGNASPEALSRVQDPNRRVVAMVINAIDSALKGDVQHAAGWRAENIRSLLDLLQKAKECGRSVLLVSDHGHVPADRLTNVAPQSGGGARWRPWTSPTDALLDVELGFSGSAIGAPRGAHGAVLLIDDASRYGGAPTAGEHGGATLSEVVAPCILIGSEDNARAPDEDKSLQVMRLYEPAWWHPSEVVVADHVPKASQLTLPVVTPAEPPTPPASERTGPILDTAFAKSALLAARASDKARREQFVHAVQFLNARGNVCASDALARELNLPNYRIGGFLSQLREALNVEGYEVVRYDAVAKQVHLDVQKLEQQFEVKL